MTKIETTIETIARDSRSERRRAFTWPRAETAKGKARRLTSLLCLAGLMCSGACSSGDDDDDDSSSAPSTITPVPTPDPVAWEGVYRAWPVYTFDRDAYTIHPAGGYITNTSDTLSGHIIWWFYAIDDAPFGDSFCRYQETITGSLDPDAIHNPACEHCGSYYSVTLSPGDTLDNACSDAVLQVYLDHDGDGQISTEERTHSDTWGVSVLDDASWPSPWLDVNYADSIVNWVHASDGRYTVWSKSWQTQSYVYLPLLFVYPPGVEDNTGCSGECHIESCDVKALDYTCWVDDYEAVPTPGGAGPEGWDALTVSFSNGHVATAVYTGETSGTWVDDTCARCDFGGDPTLKAVPERGRGKPMR